MALNSPSNGVEKIEVVPAHGFAHFHAGIHFQQHVVPAFGDGHKKGDKESHDDQPFGGVYLGDDRACFYAKYKTCRQDEDIQDGDIFKTEGISQVDQEIDDQDEQKLEAWIDEIGDDGAEQQNDNAKDNGGRFFHFPGGQGPFRLRRMLFIVFYIPVIIDHVDTAGKTAERHKCQEQHLNFC